MIVHRNPKWISAVLTLLSGEYVYMLSLNTIFYDFKSVLANHQPSPRWWLVRGSLCSGALVFLTFTTPVLSPETGIFHSVFQAQQLETTMKLCWTHAGLHHAPLNFQLSRWAALIWKTAPQSYPTRFTPAVYSLSSHVFRDFWSRLTSVSEHSVVSLEDKLFGCCFVSWKCPPHL